jgi:CRISPR-associated exonuclease Cas4
MFGVRITTSDFYYNEIRRRQRLDITDDLRSHVFSLASEMHEIFQKGITPDAEMGKNCSLCSLKDICIPKITKKKKNVRSYIARYVSEAIAPQ